MDQQDHTCYLNLAHNEQPISPGPDGWASGFVLQIKEGALDSVGGFYRFGYQDGETSRPLKLVYLDAQSAVLLPTDHVRPINGPPKGIAMKEGRYVLDIDYRVRGHNYRRRFSVVYQRKVDWGIEWIKLPS